MTDNATIKPTTRISKVWVIPILALLVGAWMVYYQWQNQGPLITIEMSSASGIEINKTPIKVRDLEVGQVKKIELKPELDGVIVTARLEKSAARLLNENTRFWLVAPRVSFSEVSGLNTLLSGSFIAMTAEPGETELDHFVALERPPVTPPGTPGLHVKLSSATDDLTYKPGDTIIYKGFKVGEFEEVNFDVDLGKIEYRAFIHAPYHKLIDESTRFWNVSGVKLQLASNGLTIQTGSLETLLANGVTFGNPQGDAKGKPIEKNASFIIYGDYDAAADERFGYAAQYVLLIDESVRGLTVGAPVEYRGLQIGKVAAINSDQIELGSLLDDAYPIPVLLNIYPGKARLEDSEEGLTFLRNRLSRWIHKDLRATLRMGNVLTGGLYVDLQHVEQPKATRKLQVNGIDVIPTVSSEFTQLTQKADAILDKMNALPLEALIEDITNVVATLKAAAKSVDATSQKFDKTISAFDTDKLNGQIQHSLNAFEELLQHYSEGGLSKAEIAETVDSLQETLRSVQPLLMQLNRTPNGLIFSDNAEINIQPRVKENNQ
ncbi:intermembrane transport protein PqiB [Alteromonas lipolytica]|uniref:Paraquat-inducible protein B n=1 Tax=Alteromonas lipolytica TaxID=1856405 RepID=A0A1E8FEP3_9ALTE|nr:intermembrane transport protein PqiB [Alteromonas lipolytica]OFI34390.1 paraquat-inducible protein B [Alteromonas lipolytica]GGF81875.1 paraquat-inducible protein B [Alteromonas lipolytica]